MSSSVTSRSSTATASGRAADRAGGQPSQRPGGRPVADGRPAPLPEVPRQVHPLPHPVLWPFLKLGGVVPVYRAQDGASHRPQPPGVRPVEPAAGPGRAAGRLPRGDQSRRTGTAAAPHRSGPDRPGRHRGRCCRRETVAVALVYDDKQTVPVPGAWSEVGDPEAADRWLDDLPGRRPRPRCEALTDELTQRLGAGRPDYSLVGRGRRYWPTRRRSRPAPPPTSPTTSPCGPRRGGSALAAGRDPEARPGAHRRRRGPVDAYRRQLALVGLIDAQVVASYRSGRLRRALVRRGGGQGDRRRSRSPPLGAVIHVVPYAGRQAAEPDPRQRGDAGHGQAAGLLLPVRWPCTPSLGVVGRGGLRPVVGLLAAVLAPACGYTAVRLAERIHRIGGAVEGLPAARGAGSRCAPGLAARPTAVRHGGHGTAAGHGMARRRRT